MIKNDVFDTIDDLSHIESLEQFRHCKNSVIVTTDVNKLLYTV